MNRFLQDTPLSFKGRANRKRYWLLTLAYSFSFVLGSVLVIALGIMLDAKPRDPITFVMAGVFVIFFMALAWASAAIAVRRLHDRGKSGFWLLLYYAAPSWISKNAGLDAAGMVFLLISLGITIWAVVDLGILRGDAGPNAFGTDPLSAQSMSPLTAAA